MSREALILAPQSEPSPAQDGALAVSLWVSHAVEHRLQAEGVRRHPSPLCRHTLTLQFSEDSTSRGVAFFGHGSTDAVFGEDGHPLIDLESCHLLRGAWFYAYACRAGVELVAHAAQPSAAAAGYEAVIIVDFQPETLRGELRDAFSAFLTTVPSMLAAGETDEREIKRQLERCADRVLSILLTLSEEDGIFPGIEIALQQLIGRLVVRSPPGGA